MKKVLVTVILAIALLSSMGGLTPSFAAITYFNAWSEHRGWDQTYFGGWSDIYRTQVWMEIDAYINDQVYVAAVGANSISAGFEEDLTGTWTGPDYRGFSARLGQTRDKSEYIPGDWATSYRVALSTTFLTGFFDFDRTGADMMIMDLPLTTVSGNRVDWIEVDDADQYRLRLIDDHDNLIFQTANLTGITTYDFTADVDAGLFAPGNYTLRMEARKNGPTNLDSRGIYFSRITVTPTPVPGTLLLLGTGILGLVRIRTRK